MIRKSKKIIIIAAIIVVTGCIGAFGYQGVNKHRYQKSMKLGASYMQEGNYDKAAEEFETATKINVKEDKTEADNNLKIANACKEADAYCQSGDYKKALEEVKKVQDMDVAEEIKSSIYDINSKIDENLPTEKAKYAQLLRDKNWLNENAEYNTAKETIRFLPLDLENDGTLDLLVFHEGTGGMAGITLSVITYDRINDTISRKDINTSHGGYVGYIEDSKTIVINYMQMGITGEIGYTLQDGEYKMTFITFDNSGSMISGIPTYKIDEKEVSEDEYKSYVEDYQSKLTNKKMYELTEENIKNTLGDSADSSNTSSESNDTSEVQDNSSSDTVKVNSKEEAIELIKKEDSNRISDSKIAIFSFVGMQKGVNGYTFPEDEYHMFNADEEGVPEEAQGMGAKYLVGKNTGNVYSTANQGGYNIYLIKDNKIAGTIKDESVPESSDWRTK